jgi:hypothetical protein
MDMKEKNMSKHIDKNTQDIPKYLKSTESNISKSNRKSKHKHIYKECLIQYKWNFKCNTFTQEEKEHIHTQLNSYCTICGKIGGYLKNGKYTKEAELLQKQSFMIWIDNGISISHKIYKLSECGITPLVLLPYPVRI